MKNLTTLLLTLLVLGGCASSMPYPVATSSQMEPEIGFDPFETILKSQSFLKDEGFNDRVWIRPDMSIDAVNKFRECYGLPREEEIHALFSNDAWKPGGCSGFGFTNSGLYINNSGLMSVGTQTKGKSFIPYSVLYSSETIFLSSGSPETEFFINDIGFGWICCSSRLKNIFEEARILSYKDEYKFVKSIRKERVSINPFPQEFFEILNDTNIPYLYVNPNIPSTIASSIKKCMKLPQDLEILSLISTNLIGSCNGLVFTTEGMFIRNWWVSEHSGLSFLSYESFLESDFIPYYKENEWVINLKQGISLDLGGATHPRTEYLNLFRSLRGDILFDEKDIEEAFNAKFVNKKCI